MDKLETATHKTKDLISNLNNFDFNSALFVFGDNKINDNFKKGFLKYTPRFNSSCGGINVKDLITNHKIFIDEKSIDQLTKRLS